MADRHFQAQTVSQLILNMDFPEAWAATIATTCIRQNQQLVGVRVKELTFFRPPAHDVVNGELRRVC
jgi:hypothetical protein